MAPAPALGKGVTGSVSNRTAAAYQVDFTANFIFGQIGILDFLYLD
jgi:hypothetical protein